MFLSMEMQSFELIFIHFNTMNGTSQDHKSILNNNIMKMSKYKENNDLAYAMNVIKTITAR